MQANTMATMDEVGIPRADDEAGGGGGGAGGGGSYDEDEAGVCGTVCGGPDGTEGFCSVGLSGLSTLTLAGSGFVVAGSGCGTPSTPSPAGDGTAAGGAGGTSAGI
jgi:hypothetical protein